MTTRTHCYDLLYAYVSVTVNCIATHQICACSRLKLNSSGDDFDISSSHGAVQLLGTLRCAFLPYLLHSLLSIPVHAMVYFDYFDSASSVRDRIEIYEMEGWPSNPPLEVTFWQLLRQVIDSG